MTPATHTPARKKKKNKIWLWARWFAVLGLALAVLLIFFSLHEPAPNRFVAFQIESGESFRAVSRRLKENQLIESEPFFYYLARLTGKSAELKAGDYELNDAMSPWEILKVITGSRVKLYRITIREGMNVFQIADYLRERGLVDKIQFLEAAFDPAFVEELHIPSFTVEGYLFPETYFVSRGTSPRQMIRMFVDMFWSKIPDSFIDEAEERELSFHEYVTMASVIEKETGLAAEMGLISSVFHNRFERGMRLQSDPTAVYDIMPYGGKVLRRHLLRKSPFNTYQIDGLPLTPITNPGLLAIQAALYPQKSDYLFFVSRRDGSHEFTTNYADHVKAIDRFLR
jgi:UPF0755 protein